MLLGCSSKKQPPAISFYYWRSSFNLNDTENTSLQNNECKTIYIKYFDVIKENTVRPVSIIKFKVLPQQKIVPVIFIKNNVFEDTAETETLAAKVAELINAINRENKITITQVQFDCDWTQKTKLSYFSFLEEFGKKTKLSLSATIRLHQVKYPSVTGIPPVKKGVLMFYNMGTINSGRTNSIYDKEIAQKYVPYLKNYLLPLDVAFPVFSWAIHCRDNNVLSLLNKTNASDFYNDSCFKKEKNGYLVATQSCFRSGNYFRKHDEIKFEKIEFNELQEMGELLSVRMKTRPHEIIFYDLDSININRYKKNAFKKIRDNFN